MSGRESGLRGKRVKFLCCDGGVCVCERATDRGTLHSCVIVKMCVFYVYSEF